MNFILKNVKLSFLALFICVGFTACDEEDDFQFEDDVMTTPEPDPDPDPDPDPTDDGSTETNTIIDFAEANGFTSLVAAVEAAGLTEELSGDTEYTVFAPDNDAFQALLDSNDEWNALEDIDADLLTQVLMNHVQAGSIMSSDLETGYISSSAEVMIGEDTVNPSLYINVDGDVMINGVAMVTNADNEVDNGVVHAVDAVIGLPDITTFATADPNFSILAEALTSAELVETLQGEGPFTVFAPTNDAFQALLDSNDDWSALTDIDADLLSSVLTYHVVSGNNTSGGLTDGMTVTTVQGQDLTINIADGDYTITDASGGTSDILEEFVDVQATNGGIHAIDMVLLPDTSGDDD